MKTETWMNNKWRPAMAWMYMAVCIFDFVIFPVLWSLIQVWFDGTIDSQWNPLTLIGAGLFHMAMGAVVGITAWSRGQEKIMNVAGTVQPATSRLARLTRPSQPPEPEL